MKLTEQRIERLSVERARRDRLIFDSEQRGLAVRVTTGGGKSYLCQYSLHGRKWRVPLGACSALSLAKAREAAAATMGDVAKGKNPAAERKAAAAAERAARARDRLTLKALIADWEREHLAEQRASYRAEAVRALHHAFRVHLDLPADDLDRAAVVGALDALKRRWKSKDADGERKRKGSAIVGRTAAYGRACFQWAMKRGTLQGNPFADLPITASVEARDRVLSDGELAEVWRAADKSSPPYGAIVRLLILTGQRKSEVAGMAWPEIADDLTAWTIPGARTKNGETHIVPLSDPAREIIRRLLPEDAAEAKRAMEQRRTQGALIFPSSVGTPFSAWSKSRGTLDAAIVKARTEAASKLGTEAAPLAPWTLHDLRRTLATGLQRLGIRLEITEAVLNHVSGSRSGIVGVYQRHDWAAEKRAALDAWGARVVALAEGRASGDNVVTLARAG
ncbi:MAG: tyrosine-type recombinase/integrase [Stellaceae bacterium]